MGQRVDRGEQLIARLRLLSGWLAVGVAAVLGLGLVSFVVAILLIHIGHHADGVTTVTTAP